MKIEIIYSFQNANTAKGLAVIIDVFRAFSTACFVINNGAKMIIPVDDIGLAYNLKKENPDYILMGERHDIVPDGFDFGNSPAEIENVDFCDKTVIHTTSAGSQGISRAINAKEIITGSFVNTQAVIDYIKSNKHQIVSLVCTDASTPKNEDIMCAEYIKSHLRGKPLDFTKIKTHLINHPCASRFLNNTAGATRKRDFDLCLSLDRFNFVLKAETQKNKLIYLKRVK
jgi:2-phosphosulfolactate phosphatase